jgi:hypothetical protein
MEKYKSNGKVCMWLFLEKPEYFFLDCTLIPPAGFSNGSSRKGGADKLYGFFDIAVL